MTKTYGTKTMAEIRSLQADENLNLSELSGGERFGNWYARPEILDDLIAAAEKLERLEKEIKMNLCPDCKFKTVPGNCDPDGMCETKDYWDILRGEE